MIRVPLVLLGPLFLLGGTAGEDYRPACGVIGVVLTVWLTVPYARDLLRDWRES